MDFKQVLILIFTLITFGVLFYWLLNIFFGLLDSIYHLLLKATWFSKLIQRVRYWLATDTPEEKAVKEWWEKWWKKNQLKIESLWEFFSEILVDPIFYGYALVVVVNRIESLNELTKQYPQYGFYRIFELDLESDTKFYLAFLVIFTVWMFGKGWKHRQDNKSQKAVTKNLENITKLLKEINHKLDNSPDNKEGINDSEDKGK